MRSAAASGSDFPYRSSTVCYIEVGKDGAVTQGVSAEAWKRAKDGESRLFAVWPGQWRSDLFVIDDLDELAGAFGWIHDEQRTGLAEHIHQVHWTVSPYEDKPQGTWITIDVRLDCGCSIKDCSVFAAHMRNQRGWNIATSGGWGSSGLEDDVTYSLRARRRSLDV